MREELGTGTNKWSEEVATKEENLQQLSANQAITAEEKLADELADELSRAPEDTSRPQAHLKHQHPQQHLLVAQKRKASLHLPTHQQLSTSVSTTKRQSRLATDRNNNNNNKQQTEPNINSITGVANVDQKQVSDNVCAACSKPIHERYLLYALDKRWHEDCLKCACCDCRLAEVGSSLFLHSDKILCRRDFARIFGPAGTCAACKQVIPPHEMVMRAHRHAYHMHCFRCLKCERTFCVGDPYYLNESQAIVCVECHELAAIGASSSEAILVDAHSASVESPSIGARHQVSQTQLEEQSEVEMQQQQQQQQQQVQTAKRVCF